MPLYNPGYSPSNISKWYNCGSSDQAVSIGGVEFDYEDVSSIETFNASSKALRVTYTDASGFSEVHGYTSTAITALSGVTSYDYAFNLSAFTLGNQNMPALLFEVYIYPHLYLNNPDLDFYLALDTVCGQVPNAEIHSFETSNLRETQLNPKEQVAYTALPLTSSSNTGNYAYYFSQYGRTTAYSLYFPLYTFFPVGLNEENFYNNSAEGVYKTSVNPNPYGYDVGTQNACCFRYSVFLEGADYFSGDEDFYIGAQIYGYPSATSNYEPATSTGVVEVFDLIRAGFSSASDFFNRELFAGVTVGGLIAVPLVLTILLAVLKMLRK